MKKIIIAVIVVVLCVIVVACSIKNNESNVEQQNPNINNEVTNQESGEATWGTTVQESGDSYVVNVNDSYKMFFEFSGETVASYYLEYEFDTEDEAILAESGYNAQDLSCIGAKNVTREGNIVRVEADLADYKDLTRTQLKTMFENE